MQISIEIVENFNPEFKVAIFIFGKKNITNISYAKGECDEMYKRAEYRKSKKKALNKDIIIKNLNAYHEHEL